MFCIFVFFFCRMGIYRHEGGPNGKESHDRLLVCGLWSQGPHESCLANNAIHSDRWLPKVATNLTVPSRYMEDSPHYSLPINYLWWCVATVSYHNRKDWNLRRFILRAQEGQSLSCFIPGDPLRAQHIVETFRRMWRVTHGTQHARLKRRTKNEPRLAVPSCHGGGRRWSLNTIPK